MHLTLKTEATTPAAENALQQRARFDGFIDRFNHERPHQALGMSVPLDYDLGYFDDETCRLADGESLQPKSVTYVFGIKG